MRKLLIVAALASASAFAITVDGGKFSLLDAEKEVLQRCDAEGGCYIFTRAMVEQYAQAMVANYMQAVAEQFNEAVKQEAKKVCGNTT